MFQNDGRNQFDIIQNTSSLISTKMSTHSSELILIFYNVFSVCHQKSLTVICQISSKIFMVFMPIEIFLYDIFFRFFLMNIYDNTWYYFQLWQLNQLLLNFFCCPCHLNMQMNEFTPEIHSLTFRRVSGVSMSNLQIYLSLTFESSS